MWLLGGVGSFRSSSKFAVLFRFAGGIEVGSAVRVAGIKVGKVESIEFMSQSPTAEDPVSLKVWVSVDKRAAPSVREDSRFFVNMAGLIGERYVEISPGSESVGVLANLSTVRGVDPPRIDQLLSQGYGVFGRIEEFMERNEKSLSELLNHMGQLVTDANTLFKRGEGKKWLSLIDNMNEISGDLKMVTKGLNDPETKAFFSQIREMAQRAHEVDKETLKKFLQDEGIRARIF